MTKLVKLKFKDPFITFNLNVLSIFRLFIYRLYLFDIGLDERFLDNVLLLLLIFLNVSMLYMCLVVDTGFRLRYMITGNLCSFIQ